MLEKTVRCKIDYFYFSFFCLFYSLGGGGGRPCCNLSTPSALLCASSDVCTREMFSAAGAISFHLPVVVPCATSEQYPRGITVPSKTNSRSLRSNLAVCAPCHFRLLLLFRVCLFFVFLRFAYDEIIAKVI